MIDGKPVRTLHDTLPGLKVTLTSEEEGTISFYANTIQVTPTSLWLSNNEIAYWNKDAHGGHWEVVGVEGIWYYQLDVEVAN